MFNGWTPSLAVNFGNTPTIYAKLDCPRCGAGLRDAAGRKLVELFADVAIPPRNRRLMTSFLVLVVGALLFLLAGMFLGTLTGWRESVSVLTLIPLLLLPWFNVAALRKKQRPGESSRGGGGGWHWPCSCSGGPSSWNTSPSGSCIPPADTHRCGCGSARSSIS
jgi:hypothetical protein